MPVAWLASLVRARTAQEDLAKQKLAEAQRRARRAERRVKYNADRIESLIDAEAMDSAPAFVAAAVALQAAAATHAAAIAAAAQAVADIDTERVSLAHAARARKTAETLQERELRAERERAAAAEQREIDEIAARVHRDSLARPTLLDGAGS